jgi:NAD(P)-dependent dehydrogenase (short-subunit alcohol dehydrogenase family)
MKTVLITGCSSGFGLELARLFLERDWRVVATMRTPRADLLPASDRLRVLALDVTDAASIQACVEAAGPVDALVNNAGVGVINPLEGVSMDTVHAVFAANTLGTIAMTQAVLPGMRAKIASSSGAYSAGTSPCMLSRAFSPKRVVGARPGSTRRVRMPSGSNSSASDSVNAFTAALLAV